MENFKSISTRKQVPILILVLKNSLQDNILISTIIYPSVISKTANRIKIKFLNVLKCLNIENHVKKYSIYYNIFSI